MYNKKETYFCKTNNLYLYCLKKENETNSSRCYWLSDRIGAGYDSCDVVFENCVIDATGENKGVSIENIVDGVKIRVEYDLQKRCVSDES